MGIACMAPSPRIDPDGLGTATTSNTNKQNCMKKKATSHILSVAAMAAFLAAFVPTATQAGTPVTAPVSPMAEPEGPDFGLSLSLTSDTFFGFVPAAQGYYGLTDSLDFTVYGIFWSAGTGDDWGNWTEFGLGFNYKPTSFLSINPQVGFLGGSLLSNSAIGPGTLGDGWVPNITINLNSDSLEGQVYFGAYLPIGGGEAGTLEFLHYWANLGYKINSFVSFGGHFEQLQGGSNATAATIYTWAGPYIQFREQKSGVFVRIAGGWDMAGGWWWSDQGQMRRPSC